MPQNLDLDVLIRISERSVLEGYLKKGKWADEKTKMKPEYWK